MFIEHNGKYYNLLGLHETKKGDLYDIVAIFQVSFCDIDGNPKTLKEYNKSIDDFMHDIDCEFIEMHIVKLINYFYGESVEDLNTIEWIAKDYINDYEKQSKKDLLKGICELEEERINEHAKRLGEWVKSAPLEKQIEIDDGDGLIDACETLKGVLENEKNK